MILFDTLGSMRSGIVDKGHKWLPGPEFKMIRNIRYGLVRYKVGKIVLDLNIGFKNIYNYRLIFESVP